MNIVNNNIIINPNESIKSNPMINNIQNWSSLNSGMLSMNPNFIDINTMNNMNMLNNNMMLNNGYISNNNPMINYNMNNNMQLNFPFYNNNMIIPLPFCNGSFFQNMNSMPFPFLYPLMNNTMNLNRFNFIGINGTNNHNENNNMHLQNREVDNSSYLNEPLYDLENNTDYIKLKKQFFKELDAFQYKNKDKFENALIEDECSICLCKYKITDMLKILPCKHGFHKKCIKKWLSNEEHNKCPFCNLDIKAEVNKRKADLEKHIYDAEHEEGD